MQSSRASQTYRLGKYLPEKDTAIEIVLSGIDASMGIFRDITEKDFQLARKALETVNATEYAERKFGILSQGEQQRILIARALVNQPGLLILDEPCAGLDPAAKVRFLDDLKLLSSRDDAPTMIFVTHHIEEIDTWIDNVMILKKGDVLSSGSKDGILTTDLLSNAFGIDMLVQKDGQKYYIRPKS